ncbi:unnamed protein product, partial [Porites evermanni]
FLSNRTFVTVTHALERTLSVRWASQLNATDVFAVMVLKEKTATKRSMNADLIQDVEHEVKMAAGDSWPCFFFSLLLFLLTLTSSWSINESRKETENLLSAFSRQDTSYLTDLTCQYFHCAPLTDVSSSEATVIPTAVSTALPASTSQPPPLEPAVIPTAVSTTSRTSTNKPSQQAKRFDLRPLSTALRNLRLLLVSTNFMSLVFLLLLLLNSACQQGWIGHGTSCYKLVTPSKTWENAKRECEKRYAKLVKVESREENDFIKTLLLPTDKDGNYWIGLSDSDNEGDWMWTDGTQLDSD